MTSQVLHTASPLQAAPTTPLRYILCIQRTRHHSHEGAEGCHQLEFPAQNVEIRVSASPTAYTTLTRMNEEEVCSGAGKANSAVSPGYCTCCAENQPELPPGLPQICPSVYPLEYQRSPLLLQPEALRSLVALCDPHSARLRQQLVLDRCVVDLSTLQ